MWTPARIGTLVVSAWVALAVPAVVAAQVTVDHETSSAATNTAQHDFSFTCTAGRPYVVLVAFFAEALAGPIASVVYDPAGSNVLLTLAGTPPVTAGGGNAVYLYTRSDGAGCNGSPKTMRVTYTDTADDSNAAAVSFNGAHAVTPFTDYTTQNVVSNPAISITVPNITANDQSVSMWAVIDPVTVTAGTQIAQTGSHVMGVSVRRAGNGTMAGNHDGNVPDSWAAAGIRVAAASSSPAPVISSLSPASGAAGQSVTINGSNFGATQGSSTVTFNGTAASATSWSASSITATVPADAGTGPVVVNVSGMTSNGSAFTAFTSPFDCPSGPRVIPISGIIVGTAIREHTINMFFCEELDFFVTATEDHPLYGGNIFGWLYNAQGTLLASGWTGFEGSGSFGMTPSGGHPWVGTRSDSSLAVKFALESGTANYYSTPVPYTGQITLKPRRPFYNITGDTPANAIGPLVDGSVLRGSMLSTEAQWAKVTLPPGGRLDFSGYIRHENWLYGAGVSYTLFNASNQQQAFILVTADGNWNHTEDGVTQTFSTTNFFTNTSGATADYLIRFHNYGNPRIQDYQVTFSVQPPAPLPAPPRLKLFLDADNPLSFDTANPNDDDEADTYVPGSNAAGFSESINTVCAVNGGQSVRLVAAYVDSAGQIVAPPSGVTDAGFTLEKTSQFPGCAMNAGDSNDTSLDFALEAGDPIYARATFTGNVATVGLRVRDYGGFTVARVFTDQLQMDALQIPIDTGINGRIAGNFIPDAGYLAYDGEVTDTRQPNVDADSSEGSSNNGDGLTAFEEYRGFVREGIHLRMNPSKKDLFVRSELPEGPGSVGNLGIEIWTILPGEMGADQVININRAGLPGAASPPFVQKAVHIKDGEYNLLNPDSLGNAQVSPNGPRDVTQAISIFTGRIREISPDTFSPIVAGEQYDSVGTSHVIAHEIGHNLGLNHTFPRRNASDVAVCPVPVGDPVTVMFTRWFQVYISPLTGQIVSADACHWQNVPLTYGAADRAGFKLK